MMFRSTCDFPSFSVIAFSRVDRKRSIRTKTTSADMNLKLSFSLSTDSEEAATCATPTTLQTRLTSAYWMDAAGKLKGCL